ncbi:MAG: adenylate/guanylate cyclase domain-containing protein [Alphaproteobacteria bacterium HGW-Alphaproteobacteria-16]|nr:MAG: adenylate/guanylate cyclase domain-containing protein [Alphaproteobacteria bacterium HGW-Alphaproteobacteria-16]
MKARGRTSLLAALLAMLLVGFATLLPAWSDLEGRAFDTASTLSPRLPDRPGVVIVAIDEPSFSALGQKWPWSRDKHAQLIEALRRSGAKAIGFDVVFADPSTPQADAALAGAMGKDVALASSKQLVTRSYGDTLIETQPLPQLVAAGAQFGVASVTADGDGVLRTMPEPDSSMEALLRTSGGAPKRADGDRMIQYFGPAGSYPTVSYYQALDPETYLPPGFFKGETVLIGLALQTELAVAEGGADAFETPYTMRTGMLTPGVEVQATIFDNLKNGLSIARAPQWSLYLLLALGAAAGLAASHFQILWLRALALIAILAVALGGSWLLLAEARLWLSPVNFAASATLAVLFIGALDFAIEQRRRSEVQGAFSQYISPTMVKRLIEDPSLLQLGGVRRDITILFADIRGFTTISEALQDEPEALVHLINDILTPLSDIVIDHGGTIDKYMGDCIMAFWNAPLDDPDHALHAVEAGRAMVEVMPQINAAIADRLPAGTQIKIGVGINTGSCVVGNMGSKQRFDYSVLGDAVNAASRLEGQSKELGVPLVIGAATAEVIGDALDMRHVGDVVLRGKAAAMPAYTLAALLHLGDAKN